MWFIRGSSLAKWAPGRSTKVRVVRSGPEANRCKVRVIKKDMLCKREDLNTKLAQMLDLNPGLNNPLLGIERETMYSKVFFC